MILILDHFSLTDLDLWLGSFYRWSLLTLVTYTKRAEHIQPILHNLHWLPINYCFEYKVATLAFKIQSTGSTAYLLPAKSNCIPSRRLKSSSQLLLSKPAVGTETARCLFNQAAPSVWNSLPVEIRVSKTARQFRTVNRTHYNRLAFHNWSRDCLHSHDWTVKRRLKERHHKHLIIIVIIIVIVPAEQLDITP